jgi:hypothetical protein
MFKFWEFQILYQRTVHFNINYTFIQFCKITEGEREWEQRTQKCNSSLKSWHHPVVWNNRRSAIRLNKSCKVYYFGSQLLSVKILKCILLHCIEVQVHGRPWISKKSFVSVHCFYSVKVKLSTTAMQAPGGRGDIAPTHSWPRPWMGGQSKVLVCRKVHYQHLCSREWLDAWKRICGSTVQGYYG